MAIRGEDWNRASDLLAQGGRTLLVSHERPDGDALGSLIALQSMLRAAGVDATAVMFDSVPPRYAWLHALCPLPRWPDEIGPETVGDIDVILVADTCTYGQLECFADCLRASPARKIAIDHHVTRDDLADIYLIDKHASATCLLIGEWAEAAGWTIDATAATALFVGLSTDTGWFRFSNADSRTLHMAARLIDSGLAPNDIYERLYASDSAGRIRLLGAVLQTLELHADNRVATMHATSEMFARCGAQRAETDDLINESMRIGSVVAAAFFVEHDDRIKVSLRSKRDVDVAAIANSFGGGGHQRAAGVRMSGSLESVKARVTDALVKRIPDATSP